MSSTTAAERGGLDGQWALISGASRGIGLECARALRGAGARLVLLGRNLDGLNAVATSLQGEGGRPEISCHVVDLSGATLVRTTLAEVRARIGGAPDIIVNNAGHFFLRPADDTSLEEFQRALSVNLASPFAIVREFLPDMKRRGSGHVVTIGSIADHQAFPGNAAYAASKYGARGLHEVLRAELRGSGVRATLVSPGPVDTALWDEVNPDAQPGVAKRAEMLAPADVADAVRYAVTRPTRLNVDDLRLSRA